MSRIVFKPFRITGLDDIRLQDLRNGEEAIIDSTGEKFYKRFTDGVLIRTSIPSDPESGEFVIAPNPNTVEDNKAGLVIGETGVPNADNSIVFLDDSPSTMTDGYGLQITRNKNTTTNYYDSTISHNGPGNLIIETDDNEADIMFKVGDHDIATMVSDNGGKLIVHNILESKFLRIVDGNLGINTIPATILSNGIAIGDSDTGLKQNGDGILEFYNNGINTIKITPTETSILTPITNVKTLVVDNSIVLNEGTISSKTASTNTITPVSIDNFSTTLVRSVNYLIQLVSESNYTNMNLSVIHNGTSIVSLVESNINEIGNRIGIFDASIVGGNVVVTFTANSSALVNMKIIKTEFDI